MRYSNKQLLSLLTVIVQLIFLIFPIFLQDKPQTAYSVQSILPGWVTASGADFIPYLSITNVSNNSGRSDLPSLELDSSGSPCIAWQDWTPGNSEIFFARWNSLLSFDDAFELSKVVDANGDNLFDDEGKVVDPGTKLTYKVDWSFNNPNNDPLFGAYTYDTIPEGTTYVAGSATPTNNLSHSTNNGSTWVVGEPPDGAPPGTILRWGPIPSGWVGAADSPYFGSAPLKPIDINASYPNDGFCEYPNLALDPSGYPCIAWQNNLPGNVEVYFIRWDGAQWVVADGSPYTGANANVSQNPGVSCCPTLQLDYQGNPCIAWQDGSPGIFEIYYVKWDGSGWVTASSQAYDGFNANVSQNDGGSYNPSLQLDYQGNPCIAWYYSVDPLQLEIYYVKWDGSGWVTASDQAYTGGTNANVSQNYGHSYYPSLQLDMQGNPCITWYYWDLDIKKHEIYYVKWDGSQWEVADGSPYTGTNANVSQNDGDSCSPSLQLDYQGNPCIAWNDSTPGEFEIYYAKWDGSQWVVADGSPYTGANANVSQNDGGSIFPSLQLDLQGNPCIAWQYSDVDIGFYQISYAKWDGTGWVVANGSPYTQANTNVSQNFGPSYNPSLQLDLQGNPHLVWWDNCFDVGMEEIIFIQYAPNQLLFQFSVKVDDPFDDYTKSPICNQASFRHAYDDGVPVLSNIACVYVKQEVKTPILEVAKRTKSSRYYPNDTFVFTIAVANTGNADATNVTLSDNFPRELIFVSSIPSATSGQSSVKFQIGTLPPGQSRLFTLKFRLAKSLSFQGDCLTLTNKATAASNGNISATDYATFMVCKAVATKELQINATWKGIDTKTNQARINEKVELGVTVEGGSSPYEVVVLWGDIQGKSFAYLEDHPYKATFGHTFTQVGEYLVTIKVIDAMGRTQILSRKVKVY